MLDNIERLGYNIVMKDKEILLKAVDKAIKNGFSWNKPWSFEEPDCYQVIFSHSFAKAFFGEDRYCYWVDGQLIDDNFSKEEVEDNDEEWEEVMPYWKRKLQIMVLEENPIKYLERFI